MMDLEHSFLAFTAGGILLAIAHATGRFALLREPISTQDMTENIVARFMKQTKRFKYPKFTERYARKSMRRCTTTKPRQEDFIAFAIQFIPGALNYTTDEYEIVKSIRLAWRKEQSTKQIQT